MQHISCQHTHARHTPTPVSKNIVALASILARVPPPGATLPPQLMLDAAQPRELVVVGGKHHEIAGAGGVNAATAGAWSQSCAPRAAFDDTAGIIAVQELTGWAPAGAVPGAGTQLKSHYLAFGAAGALLTHVRRNVGLALVPRSITVRRAIYHRQPLQHGCCTPLQPAECSDCMRP